MSAEKKKGTELEATAAAFLENILDYEDAGVAEELSVELVKLLAKRFVAVRVLLLPPPPSHPK
jgi:hypothetical protein